MIRGYARYLSSGPQYVEEAFGVDPTGTSDSTAAWVRALETGKPLRMFEGATYRISDELSLNGCRLIGDGSQTFKQYTAGYGFFKALDGMDGSEINDLTCEYMLDRSGGPASTNQYKGLSAFQRNCALWTEADYVRARNIVVKNCFTMVSLRGPVQTDSFTITAATAANPVVLTLAEGTAALITGMRFAEISGVAGMTQLNGRVGTLTVVNGTQVSIGVNGTGFSAYTSGGTFPVYDFSAQAKDIEIVGLRGDTVDLGVTAGQYDIGLIDGLTITNQTNYTVPPHAVYLNNPYGEIAVSRFTVRRVRGGNVPTAQPWIKLSDIRDSVMEDCESDGSSGFLWSNASGCRQVACNALNMPNSAIGTNFTVGGDNNQVIGGVMAGVSGGAAYGVLAEQASEVTVIGVEYVSDYTGGTSLGAGFRTQDSAQMRVVDVIGRHLQNNNNYLIGASGTSQISGSVRSNTGAKGIVRVGVNTTVTLAYDRRHCAPFDMAGSDSIRVDSGGTLTVRQFGEVTPVLLGSTVAGSHTYGNVSNMANWVREGSLVTVYYCFRITALDGTMAGDIYIDCLPFTATGVSAVYAPYARPSSPCSEVNQMLSLPASGPAGLRAEVVEGTTRIRIYYEEANTTEVVKTYLATANFTNNSRIAGVVTYRTDD